VSDKKDVVVIGGGSGGFAAAIRAAQLGGDVAVIEEAHLGGNCMHEACIPLTFLMRIAGVVETLGDLSSVGILSDSPAVDLDAVHQRKDLIIDLLRMGTEEQLADYGVEVIEGRGRLADASTVVIGDRMIQAGKVIVATGSVSGTVPVEGGDLPGVLSTREAVNLREIPGSLVVVGSQPWEIELVQYFNAMGSQVTLLVEDRRLLMEADREISQRLAKLLHDSGVDVRRGVREAAVRKCEGGGLEVTLADGGSIAAERVLASPRFPNSMGIGLREVGVATKTGGIVVNGRMETAVSGIYAVGDVTAGPMWSHKANAEGLVAAENALGLGGDKGREIDYGTLPRCLHTDPEVAWVGLTADEARDRRLEVRVGKVPAAINPQATILGQTSGAIKVVSGRYGKILGVHAMAPGAIDLINAAAVAMKSEATVRELMDLVPAHPSMGEALVDAAMDVEGRSLHLPKW